MKKHRKLTYILFVLAASLILSAFMIPRMIININESLVMGLTINDVDLSEHEDAVYRGTYTSSHMSCTAEVTVISGQITDIALSDCSGISMTRAQQITQKIITYQLLNIPEASVGTEVTDKIVLKAVEYALIRGEMV